MCEDVAAWYALMSMLRLQYSLTLLCWVLAESQSGYDDWCTRRPLTRAQENARLDVAVQAARVRTRQAYGLERLQVELRESGFPDGIGRIMRLRKKLGLHGTPVHAHHRFGASPADAGESPRANVHRDAPEWDLAHRHHLSSYRRRVSVWSRGQGSVSL